MVHPVLVPRRSQSEIDINDGDHIRAALTQKPGLQNGSSEVGEFYTATGADGMNLQFYQFYQRLLIIFIHIWMYLVNMAQNR